MTGEGKGWPAGRVGRLPSNYLNGRVNNIPCGGVKSALLMPVSVLHATLTLCSPRAPGARAL